MRLGETEFAEILRNVKRDIGELAAPRGGQLGNAGVEALDGDRSIRAVQAGQDLRQRVQRVGDRAARIVPLSASRLMLGMATNSASSAR